jgi:hypothetical protein
LAHAKRCNDFTSAGALTVSGRRGLNALHFAGRLSRTRRLKPGRYRMLITASNVAGRSTPVALRFEILS